MTDRPSAYHTPNQITGTTIVRPVVVPFDLITHVSGAISDLADSNAWDAIGVSVQEVIKVVTEMVDLYYEPWLVGMISSFINPTMPPGWLALNGGFYQQSDYPELTAVVPASWKQFGYLILPHTYERYLTGVAGTNPSPGTIIGANSKQLQLSEMPPHTHTYNTYTQNIDVESAGVPDPFAVGLPTIPVQTGSKGGGANGQAVPISLRPESLQVYFGIFAGRRIVS